MKSQESYPNLIVEYPVFSVLIILVLWIHSDPIGLEVLSYLQRAASS